MLQVSNSRDIAYFYALVSSNADSILRTQPKKLEYSDLVKTEIIQAIRSEEIKQFSDILISLGEEGRKKLKRDTEFLKRIASNIQILFGNNKLNTAKKLIEVMNRFEIRPKLLDPVSRYQSTPRTLRYAVAAGNTSEVIEILFKLGSYRIEATAKDETTKKYFIGNLRRLRESYEANPDHNVDKIELACDLATVALENGLDYEFHKEDPITTRSVIYAAQKGVPIKAAELMTEAVKMGHHFEPRLITSTIVAANRSIASTDDIKIITELIEVLTQANMIDRSIEGNQEIYNVTLAILGDPFDSRGTGDRDLIDAYKRLEYAFDVADTVMSNGIKFNYESTVDRMNMLARGAKTISEQVYDAWVDNKRPEVVSHRNEELDLFNMSKNLMGRTIELINRSFGRYEIKGETVNGIISSLGSRPDMVGDVECVLVEDMLKKAFSNSHTRIYLAPKTLEYFSDKILESKLNRAPVTALVIASEAIKHGMKFSRRTMAKILEDLDDEYIAGKKDLLDRKNLIDNIFYGKTKKTSIAEVAKLDLNEREFTKLGSWYKPTNGEVIPTQWFRSVFGHISDEPSNKQESIMI